MAPWDATGGGGGMLGGVARGCVFTSAGESGIAVAFSFLSAGPPFLGPRGVEQLVDAEGPLSSTGDARDMEPEGRFRNLNPAEVGGGQPRCGQRCGAW